MKTFISCGIKFFTMEPGDPDPYLYAKRDFMGGYIINPVDGKWSVRRHYCGEWKVLTDRQFDTENEAFNFAYDHFLDVEEKKRKKWESR